MVYIDTSVLAAYYCPEQLSGKAEAVIRRIKHLDLAVFHPPQNIGCGSSCDCRDK
jgi:predicted nucleic acid-binding protein